MFLEITWRFGLGLDIQHIDSEIESAMFEDEDTGKDIEGILDFSGLRILIPFVQIRIGEAVAFTK